MERIWWFVLNAFAISVIYAAPREYSIDELITEPRPGEEYVNIQTTSKDKVDLQDKSFTTSHRIPELSKTNRQQNFQTSHKIPLNLKRTSRSLRSNADPESWDPSTYTETKVSFSIEGSTNEPPLERVVTRTSIKMSKSKKVQKNTVKAGEDMIDLKANEGFIDEKAHADEEEQSIIKKKFLKNEGIDSTTEAFLLPLRFNVPFEDEVKEVNYDKHLLIPHSVLGTTEKPPITTFNYKNIYDKSKGQGYINLLSDNEFQVKGKSKPEIVNVSESIKTAESKTITVKKDTKQEKKDKYKKDDGQKEESGFYILPVNKQQAKRKEDNFDFVDVDEKILVPAGSSPSQSSRINVKKGPNGQDYEYEYVYYYYDDDEEGGGNGGGASKEGKVSSTTTEKVYNGHDGPPKEDREQNFVQSTSTSGNKYLPTEATKSVAKGSKKSRVEEVDSVRNETPVQNVGNKNSRGSSSRFSPKNKQPETVNNEVLPSTSRSNFRSRGRTQTTTTTTEEIPPIAEERLPPNTRFPPRSRGNSAPNATPSQEAVRTRNREGGQSRVRLPNSSLLDSSSFRTHASDASVEEDSGYDAELQRKAATREQSEGFSRRGRPTAAPIESSDVSEVSRRPTIRKPVEEKRPRIPVEEVEEEEVLPERHLKIPVEDTESEKLPKVPADENERIKVPLEKEYEEEGIGKEKELPESKPLPTPQQPEFSQAEFDAEGNQGVHNGHGSLAEEAAVEGHQNVNGNEEIQRQPDPTGESVVEEGAYLKTSTQTTADQVNNDQDQENKLKVVDSTTEDQSAVGLTSAMMEKVALELYAILQQAQNENIRTNFIDGNSTDITTDSYIDGSTDSTIGDEPTSPITTTTTTTTTTPAPTTTTTTTTTTPAPSQAPGRGRYRTRVAGGAKGRSKVTTTTTEPPEEVTSPKTRGRFHANHGGTRGSGLSFTRKSSKPVAKESGQEAPVSEETPKAAPEKSFGERPRSRFRTSGKVNAAQSTTAAPSALAAPAAPAAGVRISNDRFNVRRRGGARIATTQQSAPTTSGEETSTEEEKHEANQDTLGSSEEGAAPAPTLKPTRPRIGGAVRPLRPGPRAPLILHQRGHTNVAVSSTQPPAAEQEVTEKEVVEQEANVSHQSEESQEASTPAPGDALTRLKSRPRLRIGPAANHQRPQASAAPPGNRRKLVSSLLPKRKPNEDKPIQKEEETEEKPSEEAPVEEDLPSASEETVVPSSTADPEPKGLTGLLAGRRRNLNRRPGTLYSKAQPTES